MKVIEKLEPSRHIQGRFLVWFSGEKDPVKVTENEVLSFSLYRGRELEEETVEQLLRSGGESSAKARAARMLGQRPLSRKELIQRLEEKGELPEDAVTAADYLEEIGALNDLEYGRAVVRHYCGRGYGVQKLRMELQRRGVPRDLWEEALEEQSDPIQRVELFIERRLRGKQPEDEKEIKRVTDALMRRGFRWEEIRTGLARYGSELEEEDI